MLSLFARRKYIFCSRKIEKYHREERDKMTDKRRINSGYVITASVPAGNKEFVLGVHKTAPEQYVTWECRDGDYIWGHYTDSPLKALRDLCGRILGEVEYLEVKEQEAAEGNQKSNQPESRQGCGQKHLPIPGAQGERGRER